MEHSSLDLSIVKKEPGFVEPFSSESGLFDNMMSDDFHDPNFHSLVSSVVYSWKDRSKSLRLISRALMRTCFFANRLISSHYRITAAKKYRWTGYHDFLTTFRLAPTLRWATTVCLSTLQAVYRALHLENHIILIWMALAWIVCSVFQRNAPMNRCIAHHNQLLKLQTINLFLQIL